MTAVGSRVDYGAVAVGATAVGVKAARSNRKSITIQNVHASQILYIGGDASVTTSNGLRIAAGAERTIEGYNGPIYGIASGAATDVRVFEVY